MLYYKDLSVLAWFESTLTGVEVDAQTLSGLEMYTYCSRKSVDTTKTKPILQSDEN